MKQPFRITIEHYNTKVSIEKDHSDLDISEVVEMIEQALIAAGYSADTVEEIFAKSF